MVDNLWIAHHKPDHKHFLASINALCQYILDKSKPRFKYYVIIHGKTNEIFQTWLEVMDSIKGVRNLLYKGFNDFFEALDYARGHLGPNFYLSPALRQNPGQTP